MVPHSSRLKRRLISRKEGEIMQQGTLTYDYRQSAIIADAAWSPDGRSIAIGDSAGQVHLWDAQTGQMTLRYESPSGGISSLAWSPSGTQIASGDMDGRVTVWEAVTGKALWLSPKTRLTSEEGDHSARVAWSPDGRILASSGYQKGQMTIQLWDALAGERRTNWPCGGYIAELQWSPGGEYLAVGDSRGTLHLWNLVTGQEVASYHRPGEGGLNYINTIAWLPGEDQVAFGDTRGIVQVWDVREQRLQLVYTPEANSIEELISWNPTPINGLAWLPGGTYLISACRSVQIREASTGKRVTTFLDPFANDDQYIIHQVDWSPDWRRTVSVGARFVPGGEGCMYVWELGEMVSDDYSDAPTLE